jgi:hypothetical protein
LNKALLLQIPQTYFKKENHFGGIVMKKAIPWLATLFAFSFILVGCSSSGGGDDNSVSAPKLPDVSTVTITGATSAPASEADAQALYTDSLGALSSLISSNSGASSSRLSRGNARKTESTPVSLDKDITSPNGGVVHLKGSVTYTTSGLDENTAFIPNHTYNNAFSQSIDGNVTGTMDSVKVIKDGHTYTICGTLKEIEAISMSVNLTTGATQQDDMTYTVNLSLGLGIGTAISVVREDGVGAKFVITYAANYAKDNITVSENSDGSETDAAFTEMANYLKEQKATLTVYDQNNTEKYKCTLSGNDQYTAANVFGD